LQRADARLLTALLGIDQPGDFCMVKTMNAYSQVINMPQMALSGLSESWLMKEIGGYHWQMLCDDLGVKSNEIFDEFGNRLYATFVRIKFESCSGLAGYNENDKLKFSGEIQRFGNSLYYSQVVVACNDKKINCSLATTFSTREEGTDNTKLTKGVPSKSDNDVVVKVSEMPKHILDIVKIKKSSIHSILVSGHNFEISDKIIHETQYKINPYTDINGVGLLYFAAYPTINDVCELEYFNDKKITKQHWALSSSTLVRDVFYFGNCNIDDLITYKLNSIEIFEKNKIAIQSSLHREKTDTIIAKIFTVKEFVDN
jgi:probable biosynthetic protein (TIGR04098 family)